MTENPVLVYAKAKKETGAEITLSTGYPARIIPVGSSLIEDIINSIPEPKIPTFFNEDKQREEENPSDPSYLQAMTDVQRRRAMAAMEALLVFGVEVALPDNEAWLNKLRYLERRKAVSLDGYDLDDPLDRDLLFKKYVAIGTADLIAIGRKAGLNAADIEDAARTFQSK